MVQRPSAALLARLKDLLGPAGTVESEADKAPYLTDWRRRYRGDTPLVLRPGTTAEVQAVVGLCAAAGVALVPQGGNTGLVGGGTPFEHGAELLLSLTRLNRIRAVDPIDDTLVAEAGVTLAGVQAAAAAVDRLYPVSLASQGSCTIGGNVATNAGGIHVLRYGMTREQVLGLEVVLPDGRLWNGLRSLRKDNTGYDLKQLFIGSEGTLGVVTAACLRLWPRPAERVVALAAVPDVAAGLALFGRLRAAAGQTLSACEIFSERGLQFVLAFLAGSRRPLETVAPWYVLLEVLGDHALHDTVETVLAAAFEAGEACDGTIAESEAQAMALWALREHLSDAQTPQGASLKHDVALPLAALGGFVAQALAAVEAAAPGVRPVVFGHLGDGNLHFNLTQPPGLDGAAFLARTDELALVVHDIVHAHGGSIAAEHGLGRLKIDAIDRYHDPVERSLMAALKQALDPGDLMNPGKLVRPA